MNIHTLSKRILHKSEAFAEVMSSCTTLLKHNPNAEFVKNYLYQRVPSYNCGGTTFGFFPSNSQIHLLTEYVGEDILCDLGLLYKRFVNDGGVPQITTFGVLNDHNLVMPYRNLNGDIIALVGRSLLPEQKREQENISKYKNTKFHKSMNLFGLYKAKQAIIEKGFAIVTEGQFDCINCHHFGFNNVVALGGISLTKFQFYLLMRYTDTIYLLLDNDVPGIKATDTIINRYKKIANIKRFDWKNRTEKDPDELVKNGYDLNHIERDILD